jgi:uncharacterized protein (TIRG00374 family)
VGFLAVRLVLLCLLLGALAWAASKLDWHLIGSQLSAASVPAELGMAAASLMALFIRPVRLQVLLRTLAPQTRRGYWTVWSADLIAMATNSVVPMRAGDMMMAFVLRGREGDSTARIFSVVVIDRLFDFAVVVVLFVSALSWAPTVASWASQLRITLLVALAAIGVVLWLAIRLRVPFLHWLDRLLTSLAPRRGEGWLGRLHDVFAGLAIVDKPRTFAPVLLLSICVWGVTATSFWFGIIAIWPSGSFAAGAFAAGAIALSSIMPVSPGGIGVFHAVVVLALSLFDVPAEPGLAIAIIIHAFQLGSVLILASVSLTWQGISVRSLAALRDTRP